MSGSAHHPDLTFKNCSIDLVHIDHKLLVELRVLASSVDDSSGDGVVRIVSERELGVDVLVVVDADVVDVSCVVNEHLENSREALMVAEPRRRSLFQRFHREKKKG